MSRPQRYTGPAIALHWLLALLIAASLLLGSTMTELAPSPTRLALVNAHQWSGIVILGLTALRLLWRLGHRPPEPPLMPAWQRRAAAATHGLLYLLCFAVPLAGWAYSSAAGFPVVLFGLLPLPDWVAPDRALAALIKPLHAALAYALAALIALHVAAALKHHVVDDDGLLRRMVPGRNRP